MTTVIPVPKSRLALAALSLLAAALVPASPETARAEVGAWPSKLTGLRSEATSARGPEAYVALRRLWREWESGDPALVEEAIHEVAIDGRATPATRAYAGLLEAYARRRRGDLDGARSRIAALG